MIYSLLKCMLMLRDISIVLKFGVKRPQRLELTVEFEMVELELRVYLFIALLT
jgi:hypothetical protein